MIDKGRRGFLRFVAGSFVAGSFARLAPPPPPPVPLELERAEIEEFPQYEVRIFSYANLVATAPGWHMRITGL